MLWAVAGRFHFSESELWGMTMRRLAFWYEGHSSMCDEERRAHEDALKAAGLT